MKVDMKDNFLRARYKVRESSHGLMEKCMMVFGGTTCKMAKLSTTQMMVHIVESGKRDKF